MLLFSGGVYTLMCALHDVFRPLVRYRCNFPIMGRYRVRAVREIHVNATRSGAERHLRDFATARTLVEAAEQLVLDARQMATPRTRRILARWGIVREYP